MTTSKFDLAEKFRQNWQSQYPFLNQAKLDRKLFQPQPMRNIVKHNTSHYDLIDDSLTNLNWLQNLNLISLSPTQPPLSPPTIVNFQSLQQPQQKSQFQVTNRIISPYFETSSIYEEVTKNLEFMIDEASVKFFKANNQLRPPFSDISLISMAIYSYSKPKVSFPEICGWIEDTFPYYKKGNQDWKIDIKNHLTLSKCFQKVPRRKEELEKGGFWQFSNEFIQYMHKNSKLTSKLIKDENVCFSSNDELFSKYNKNVFINSSSKITNCRKRSGSSIDKNESALEPSSCDTDSISTVSAFKTPRRGSIDPSSESGQTNLPTLEFNGLSQQQFMSQLSAAAAAVVACGGNNSGMTGTPIQSSISLPSIALSNFQNNSNSIPSLIESHKDLFNQIIEAGGVDVPISCNGLSEAASICISQPLQNNICNNLQSASSPCPEQITEEEFLSGKAFGSTYISQQGTDENFSTLFDSEININDLSITGVGIKPPEWWNQSFSASQFNISRFGLSLRSLTVGNGSNLGDSSSPLHGISNYGLNSTGNNEEASWYTDHNIEELDVLLGLS